MGKHIFTSCICGLLEGKTRVLVTHQLQYLPAADRVVVMANGTIAAQGTYSELVASGIDFKGFETVREHAEVEKEKFPTTFEEEEGCHYPMNPTAPAMAVIDTVKPSSPLSPRSPLQSPRHSKQDEELGRVIDEEARAVGHVERSLYLHYFRCWGTRWYWMPLGMLGLALLDKGLQVIVVVVISLGAHELISKALVLVEH